MRGAAAAVIIPVLAGACSLFQHEAKETPMQVAARESANQRIQREVEARLAAEPSIGAGKVRVAVEGAGEVSLFGAVSGLGALRCAERNTELVHGVRLLIDQLVLDPGPKEARCLSPRVFGAQAQR